MTIFKCKMCGGTLEINNEETVGVCEYCGTKQTLSKTNDEFIVNLFNRANNLRLKCEFDKATQIYEKIVEQDATEAEAYWGIVLCKYGIEYVEDSKTFERIPTCHRTLYEAVTSDVDYIAAIEHADLARRMLYEKEAKAIENIQKDILNIVKNEKPFDVFICYKETDETGKRTVDSVIANDIYHELTEEGFKVFYSAITLEEKIGQEYEPYIFAALNSAKVMLVIGTRPEYFEAVWVKNEWGRFLKLMKQDRSKLLIPCYKDMDAYELPEDFAHLQAQDMGKIGFINDVIRGIKKVLSDEGTEQDEKEAVVVNALGASEEPLLKRAFMFLEDGEFERADEFCEQVLNLNPENAKAYLGKLMAELQVKKQEHLSRCDKSFENNNNYQKVIRFADEKLIGELKEYVTQINQRIAELKEAIEEQRKDKIYDEATLLMNENSNVKLRQAIMMFESIPGWKDSEERMVECRGKIEKLEIESVRMSKRVRITAIVFVIVVVGAIIMGILFGEVIIPSNKYNEALGLLQNKQYNEAISILRTINYYKDSKELIRENAKKNISVGTRHTVGLKLDGTVVAVGDNEYGQCNVSEWTDIVEISAGGWHTVGLKLDGTVIDVGFNEYGQCNVSEWTDIVEISAGAWHTVGLKLDGTVVAVGDNEYGQCNVSEWTDIVEISAEGQHTVGLKSDGTVVAVGDNEYGQCNVSEWTDIVEISAGRRHTVRLKSDGTVVAVGDNEYGQCNVSEWTNITEISAIYHTIGLRTDGTVVAVGDNQYGQCNVSGWRDVVAISVGSYHTVGLKLDGTVVEVGDNEWGQGNLYFWNLFEK